MTIATQLFLCNDVNDSFTYIDFDLRFLTDDTYEAI